MGYRDDGRVALKICDKRKLRRIVGGKESVQRELEVLKQLHPDHRVARSESNDDGNNDDEDARERGAANTVLLLNSFKSNEKQKM